MKRIFMSFMSNDSVFSNFFLKMSKITAQDILRSQSQCTSS